MEPDSQFWIKIEMLRNGRIRVDFYYGTDQRIEKDYDDLPVMSILDWLES